MSLEEIPMVEKYYTIIDDTGIHARPSTVLIN